MSLPTRPAAARPYPDRSDALRPDDRLPLYIAGPIIIVLSLSLWGGIGFLISALL